MSSRTFHIERYKPVFDAGLGRVTRIALIDTKGVVRCELAVLDGPGRSYEPCIDKDLERATAFVAAGSLSQLLDLLRNESDLKLTLEDTPPGDVRIHT
jgi:hypothetical protein